MNDELDKALAECEGHIPGPWKIMADPENKGRHEYHDNRWIVSGDPVVEYGHDPRSWGVKGGSLICEMRDTPSANARLIALAPTLAAAVRILRETVKAKDEEIARLKLSWDSAEAQIDDVDAELRDVVKENAALCRKLHEAGINPSIDQALNEGDGTYKP